MRHEVPAEAQALVRTLNRLLDRISRPINSKDELVSIAAQQLRTPVAGILASVEAVQNAPDQTSAKKRSAELVEAALQTSQLTNQFLSFDRATGRTLNMPVSARLANGAGHKATTSGERPMNSSSERISAR
ncbi:histidine kinase dimerization/phospho-acceptor domain-containing protein [Tropicimonas sp. S265A]|uniref:histidine kinase dimerization/phospho-acceptor domain-containing protein n=1 Tax=Tropicimonas sp. S265A TaxID=3415134 RepID=UPI003C7BA5EC